MYRLVQNYVNIQIGHEQPRCNLHTSKIWTSVLHVKTCQVRVASTLEMTVLGWICTTSDLGEVNDGPTETWVTIAIM